MSSSDQEHYDKIIHDLMNEGISLHQLAAGLLKMQFGHSASDFAEPNPPGPKKKGSGSGKRDFPGKGQMVRLFISLGKKDKVSKGDIAGGVAGLAGLHGEDIGIIDLYDKFSFVEVSKKDLHHVIEKVNGNKIKGRKVNVEIAR